MVGELGALYGQGGVLAVELNFHQAIPIRLVRVFRYGVRLVAHNSEIGELNPHERRSQARIEPFDPARSLALIAPLTNDVWPSVNVRTVFESAGVTAPSVISNSMS